MRILIFGDSITQGYWAVEGGWVERLRRSYDKIQFGDLRNNDEPTVFNLGISADNTEALLRRFESETKARTRHEVLPVALMQIGINDSSTGEGSEGIPLDEYKQNLERLVEIARPLASQLVFVGSSACDDSQTNPVFWGSFFYANEQIKLYEDAMAEVARKSDVAFIPLFDRFKAELDKDADFLADGLHPNDAGHEFIYNLVRSKLEDLLDDVQSKQPTTEQE